MTQEQAIEILHAEIIVLFKIAAPILLLSMVVGLLISIFQAATQIHEQTITFVPKLFFIGLVLFIAGSWMGGLLKDYTIFLFDKMLQL